MGNARARGDYETRKAQAIAAGRVKADAPTLVVEHARDFQLKFIRELAARWWKPTPTKAMRRRAKRTAYRTAKRLAEATAR